MRATHSLLLFFFALLPFIVCPNPNRNWNWVPGQNMEAGEGSGIDAHFPVHDGATVTAPFGHAAATTSNADMDRHTRTLQQELRKHFPDATAEHIRTNRFDHAQIIDAFTHNANTKRIVHLGNFHELARGYVAAFPVNYANARPRTKTFAIISGYPPYHQTGHFSKPTIWTHGIVEVRKAPGIEARLANAPGPMYSALEPGHVLTPNEFLDEVRVIARRI